VAILKRAESRRRMNPTRNSSAKPARRKPGCALSLWRLAALAGTLLLHGPAGAAGAPTATKEYQIKAAFLYNFTKFVEWPADRFADATSPIVIGVLGKNPFGDELEKIVSGRTVNGRSITIVQLQTAAEIRPVHAVFVADGEESLVGKQISPLASAGVLLVGESDRFLGLGGTVRFTNVDDKVRFEINMAAAEQGGLKVSAQLQKLAAIVRRKL
jgi:hypothetical protein